MRALLSAAVLMCAPAVACNQDAASSNDERDTHMGNVHAVASAWASSVPQGSAQDRGDAAAIDVGPAAVTQPAASAAAPALASASPSAAVPAGPAAAPSTSGHAGASPSADSASAAPVRGRDSSDAGSKKKNL
jgi:hypothetical protein